MAYTPTHNLAKALNILRNTIAATATFRAVTDTTTQAEALARVVFPNDAIAKHATNDKKLLVARPRAIVRVGNGWAYQSLGVGQYQHILPLAMTLEFPPPEAQGGEPIAGVRDIEWLWFHDKWAAIVAEMVALMRTGVDGDGNRMLASDAPVGVTIQPDIQEAEHDLIDEEFYYVGLQWNIDVPVG